MPKWITDDQRSADWFKARCGVLTASKMADAILPKSGKEGETRRKLKYQILAERMTGTVADGYVSAAMMRGIEMEPAAKERFEELTGVFIQECGFALHDEIPGFGASPDGLIGDEEGIEIKCPDTHTHLKWMMAGVVPEEHRPQILTQLSVTTRKRWWFMSYDDRLPAPYDAFIVKYEPDQEQIKATEASARVFLAEVAAMQEELQAQQAA